jgi:hypothetical protein
MGSDLLQGSTDSEIHDPLDSRAGERLLLSNCIAERKLALSGTMSTHTPTDRISIAIPPAGTDTGRIHNLTKDVKKRTAIKCDYFNSHPGIVFNEIEMKCRLNPDIFSLILTGEISDS